MCGALKMVILVEYDVFLRVMSTVVCAIEGRMSIPGSESAVWSRCVPVCVGVCVHRCHVRARVRGR